MACSVGVQPPPGYYFGVYMLRGDRPVGHLAPAQQSYGLQLRGSPLRWQWGLNTRVAGAPCVSRRRAHSFFRLLVFPARACWRSPARWWAGALPGSPTPRLGFVLGCAARRVWAGGWAV